MLGQAEGLKTQPKVINVVGGKGGVGKSIVSVNLAIALSELKRRVLLFDADIGFGSVEVLIGTTSKLSLKDYFQKKIPLSEIITGTEFGIDVLSSGLEVEDLVYFNVGDRNSLYRDFTNLLGKYDYIVLDFPPGYNENLESFYEASDFLVVVTTPEPTALVNTYTFLKMMMIKGIDPNEVHIVMNMVRDMREGRRSLERFVGVIERFIGMAVTATHIMRFENTVRRSVECQRPFVLYKKSLQPSLVIHRVANMIARERRIKEKASFIEKLKAFLGIG